VLLASDGEASLVTVASVEASAAGIERGMTASQAHERCPAAMAVRDNANACLDELERMASMLRMRATTDVAIVSRDALIVSLRGLDDLFPDEAAAATAIVRLARSWTGLDVRAGVADTAERATALARTARRFPAICQVTGPGEVLPALPDSLAGRMHWRGEADPEAAGDRLLGVLRKLEAAVEVHGLIFREVSLEVARPSGSLVYRLRCGVPLHGAAEAHQFILARLGTAVLSGATGVEVVLGRLGPAVRVEPWRPAVTRVHALAGPAVPVQRHLQLAS
jgi:hypothetical protein